MNENEKEKVLDEENVETDNQQQADADSASSDGFETNDNWQFEAEAPTLGDNVAIGNEFELETSDVPKTEIKKKEKKPKKENIVINKKKLRVILISVVSAVLAAAIILFGVVFFFLPNSSEKMYPGNVALTVGNTKVSVGMYNLYYNLVVSNYKQYAESGTYSIDFTKDLADQETVDENDNVITWEEAIELDTIRQLQFVSAYYEPAVKDGVGLTDEQKSNIETSIDNFKSAASEAGQSLNEYLEENYGKYCGVETIEKFYEQRNICENYYNQMQIKLTPTEEETEKYYDENQDDYITFAYIENQYSLDGSDESIKSIDDVKKKTEEYCKQIKTLKDMKNLIPEACSGLVDMAISQGYFSDEKSAIATLKDSVVVTYNSETIVNNFGEDTLNWFKSDDRKEGDVTYYINEDYGYSCIFLYTSEAKPDETELYSVRHILISPKDDPNEVADATEAEWTAAQVKAQTVLDEYNKGDKTEIAFAELAEKYSVDTNSTSAGSAGMYGGEIKKAQLGEMVPEFEQWATDKSRQYGDVDIVKTQFGYHIMYFIYDGPTYLFNVMDDVNTKKLDEFISSVEYKKHLAFHSATVFKVETETETDSVTNPETAAAAE